MAVCKQCNVDKVSREFYYDGKRLRGKCKECVKANARKYREDPSRYERIKEYDRTRPARY